MVRACPQHQNAITVARATVKAKLAAEHRLPFRGEVEDAHAISQQIDI
jgi:hypothetical protein